jgi:hypothetical protein
MDALLNTENMQITLEIQDSRFSTFLEFIKTLDYVSINREKESPQWQQDEVSKRLKLIESGEMKTRDWFQAKADVFSI